MVVGGDYSPHLLLGDGDGSSWSQQFVDSLAGDGRMRVGSWKVPMVVGDGNGSSCS
jgi:hypothetical protein